MPKKEREHHTIYKPVIDSADKVPLDGLGAKNFIPHPKHILVERLPPEEKIGSFIIPETYRQKQSLGIVRAISPIDDGGLYALGDLVLFAKNGGQAVSVDGKDMAVLEYDTGGLSDVFGRWPANLLDADK